MKLLLDTDIGNDIDDALALAYLLREPQCELLGVTTVCGEPEKRCEMASAICHHLGRPDVPIHPGCPVPLSRPQLQPVCPPNQRQSLLLHCFAVLAAGRNIRVRTFALQTAAHSCPSVSKVA